MLFVAASGCQPALDDAGTLVPSAEKPFFPSVLPAEPLRVSVQPNERQAPSGTQNSAQRRTVFGPIPPAQLVIGATPSLEREALFAAVLPPRDTPKATPTLLPTKVVLTATSQSNSLAVEMPRATSTATKVREIQRYIVVAEESIVTYQLYVRFVELDIPQLVIGKTQDIAGEIVLATEPPHVLAGRFEVNLPALNSRDPRRDLAIRSEWLESDRYPVARFEVTDLENGPSTWEEGRREKFSLLGELMIRDLTRNITFDVSAVISNGVLTGTATTEIQMADFGVEPPVVDGLLTTLDGVTLIIYLTAVLA